ncbi:hypothetical protein BDY19DRAFT_942970 [Irpex rosettiformis]|uniref:Uncharacterized protein n=1 Tax=Irpex rosettiformis TaxID=378272 RepID=A0ACB8U608_9APHY|nr:hypothetical protein BDY19DRAFT_942970 [Irpex rosettiformis]
MTSLPLPINEDSIQWTQAKSKNGVPFEIGVVKDAVGEAAQFEAIKTLGLNVQPRIDAHILVNWPVNGDVWVTTQPGSQAASYISRYKLDINHWSPIWDWKLEFTNIVNGRFQFIDETEDEYRVDCERLGDHYVRYNSARPTIRQILYTRFA